MTLTFEPETAAGTAPELQESAARLRALADNLPHAMIYQIAVDPHGLTRRFTFVGRSCERLNGVTAEAVLADGAALYGLIAPEDQAALAAAEAEALQDMRPFDMEVALVRPDGERRWSRISSAPRLLSDGSTLWDGIQLDITESRLAREALEADQNRLALAVEATGLGLWDFDLRTGVLHWDEAVKAAYGLAPGAEVDYAAYVAHLHPEDRDRVVATYRGAIAAGESGYRMEHRTLAPDGTVRWVLGCARILRDRAGAPTRLFGSVLDITERKRAEEHLQFMVHELNHRVKNSMSVVQAIAARTLRNSPGPVEAGESLSARLLALARTHDLLTAESWAGAGLAEVVSRSLGALGAEPPRLAASGPAVRLHASAALTLALVFHELGTNAVKYGSLSMEGGRVEVEWTVEPGDRLRLCWRERGGPPAEPPTRRGFGSQMIERGLAVEFGAEVKMAYGPEGLDCTIEGAMNRLSPQS
ncbi:MAG TPA: PAS domain-containing protein [Caulobacteraceae bacterium]|nr:PAS domain-containing protein [Caulobacteraceae bacterium]